MKAHSKLFRRLVHVCAAGLTACALLQPAAAASIGEVLAPFTLEDERQQSHTLGDEVRRIYVTADRKGDKLFKKAMKERGQADLDAQAAIVVADISGAPGFVKRIIRSSLKDRSYSTWLDLRGDTRSLLPYREDQVCLCELQARRITDIRCVDSVEALAGEIDARANPDN